jgi:Ser/Thr protein kinase RdoA (MazF antagonist)
MTPVQWHQLGAAVGKLHALPLTPPLTRQDVIGQLVDRADRLGRRLARSRPGRVLCHADLHTWNVLVDTGQRL